MTAKKKIQIGIIGCGRIAQRHAAYFAKDTRTEIRWIADTNPASLETMAGLYAVSDATQNYTDMLGDTSLDVVVVCTPPDSHYTIGIKVLRAGKHLVVEKPLTIKVTHARKLLTEAKKHPELMITGCSARHTRLQPKYEFIRNFIRSGKIGNVYHIHHRSIYQQSRYGLDKKPAAGWFLDRKISGGGPLFDWGVYDLAFHLGVVGQPQMVRVVAFCKNRLDKVRPRSGVFTVEEHGGAMMEFKGGLTYYWERASNAHYNQPDETIIYGTKGGLTFSYPNFLSTDIVYYYISRNGRGKAQCTILPFKDSSQLRSTAALDKAIIDALYKKRQVPMPFEIEVKNLEIIDAVYKAARW